MKSPLQGRDGLAYWTATSGGAGRFPYWPGTVGAAVGLALAALLAPLGIPGLVAASVVLLGMGTWASGVVADRLAIDDPQVVVIDETFGAVLTLALIPAHPLHWALGFLAFRAFDIVKPWPVDVFHRRRGGLAIMLDDGVAALLAAATVGLLDLAFAIATR